MFDFNIEAHKYKNIFFIGIGGISMSALAELMIYNGYKVFGSDKNKSYETEKLESKGAKIYYEHKKEHIKDMDLIIYTDAISMDNEELKAAIVEKKDIIDRASFLGAIMKSYNISIAISGTHGKTSTTSMVAEIIKNLDTDPTIMLGGQLDDINGNIKIGKEKKLFLTEACEYKANILKLFPTTAVILNIDEDHLDYFDNIDHIIRTFKGFTEKLNKDDYCIINIDDENTRKLLPIDNAKLITFAIDKKADYMAKNIDFDMYGRPYYDLYYKDKYIGKVELAILGYHNIYNTLAAIGACHENGIDFEKCIKGIGDYKGVHRRLEFKGLYKNSRVMDDYAHHPTEIKSSISAIKKSCKKRLFTVFQPHTFTRTKLLLDSFAKSFDQSDVIIITDIYAAREKDYGDIHSKTLVDAISNHHKNAIYIKEFSDIIKYLKENLKDDDTVVTMGAGNVYKIGDQLLNKNNWWIANKIATLKK